MTNGSSLIIRGDSYHKSIEITRIEMETWVLNIVPQGIFSKKIKFSHNSGDSSYD